MDQFKIRPFEHHVERELDRPVLTFKGLIQGNTLVIQIDAIRIDVPLTSAGRDDHGDFCFVQSSTHQVQYGLQVVLDGDENEGSISLKDEANARGFGVYFTSGGFVDGKHSQIRSEFSRTSN